MELLYNANIHTLDGAHPHASALLVDGGRVAAVGDRGRVENFAHGKIKKHDLKGGTVIPGLTDAHLHIQHYALGLARIDCETRTESLRAHAQCARSRTAD